MPVFLCFFRLCNLISFFPKCYRLIQCRKIFIERLKTVLRAAVRHKNALKQPAIYLMLIKGVLYLLISAAFSGSFYLSSIGV